jgi:hypothetical protein
MASACVRLAAALLASLAAPAGAAEPPLVIPLFVEVPPVQGAAGPGCVGTAILTAPGGWSPGDAAAVVLADHERPDPARDRLTGALLAEGAAVLELAARGLCGGAAGPVPALFAALRTLRREAAAGLVVAIGHGPGGEAALEAVAEARAAAHLGRSGERFAAAARLGADRAVFAPGPAPPAAEAWPLRARLLCATLAGAATDGTGEAARRQAADACASALAASSAGSEGRRTAAAGSRR